jgi:aerobic-type carbon monoxide dehydrogenase small subunit (CoxS/CutS family)
LKIKFVLNDEEQEFEVEPDAVLLDVIRASGLTGTKEGCAVGVCGACTVVINDVPVSSCIYFAALADGAEVLTIEGIAKRDPSVIQAFVEHEGMQCGICTPGQVVAAYTLKREHPGASEDAVREYMAGNLCRCTGYVSITDSVRAYVADV